MGDITLAPEEVVGADEGEFGGLGLVISSLNLRHRVSENVGPFAPT